MHCDMFCDAPVSLSVVSLSVDSIRGRLWNKRVKRLDTLRHLYGVEISPPV
jgi:hypothetical protein